MPHPFACMLVLVLPVLPALAQDGALAEYDKLRSKALAENGQRHLRLGSWARDQGLVPQATAEFLLAVEVAEGQNPGALTVLGIMRSLDDRFWTERKKRPSRALLDAYDKRARKARKEDHAARLKLARFADARKLEDQALQEYRALLGDIDEPIEVDGKGRIVLEVGTVPADLSAKILAQTVQVEAKQYLKDAALAGLPDAATIHERVSPELRLRGTLPAERIEDLHALGQALLPHLEERIGGRPVQRVQVFVFATRAEYATYLAANAMQRFTNASGFADYGAQQAIVCAEGCDDVRLRGLFLHELAHLYDYQVAPSALPSWYREAFAESLGGPGAYDWRDGKLLLGGAMAPAQRERLRAGIDTFSLRALLDADVGTLFVTDVARAHRFYLEAWGLLEFLRGGAGTATAARFEAWEAMCRGKALGAGARQPGKRDRVLDEREARAAFERLFGGDLDTLERDFKAWVQGS
jgi:hypothetical protein